MRLYEFEGKRLLQEQGFSIPPQQALAPIESLQFSQPCALKAQLLFGNRKAQGLIELCPDQASFLSAQQRLKQSITNSGFSPESTLVLQEPLVSYSHEFYVALRYDTRSRRPVVLFSASGGSGIEERSSTASLQEHIIRDIHAPRPGGALDPAIPSEWLDRLFASFLKSDATLIEINPLVLSGDTLVVLDAKIELDDTAHFRHEEWNELYPPRTLFLRQPTENEKRAKEINAMDHRGVAGASYFDFDGTIGILASGGGASTLAMDTLLATSLRPANYTEYSGNPTREKVAELAKLVLSKPDLEGLWVVGGHANFTDLYETLMGVMDGIEAVTLPPGFPIVIRRGGPRLEEAFAALRERAAGLELRLHLFDSSTPIPDTAFLLEQEVKQFREQGAA